MDLMKQVAEILLNDLAQMLLSQAWKRAYLAVRCIGKSRVEKYRLELADGSLVKTTDPPDDVHSLLYKAFKLRDEAFPEKWYEMRITVFPDKKCAVDFNYDPECLKKSFRD